MNQEWKMVPISPTAEMIAAGMAVYGATARYNAMLAAAPVPPAGDVEVLGWRALGSNFNTEEFAVDYAKWAGEVSPIVYLVDRAHVTRLQAEVSALQKLLNIADQRASDLTWFAKSAYMEGWELGWVTRHTDANNEKRVTPWAPPREVMEREWLSSEGRAALNKSAPAAKVDCGNCAFVADVCLTECESKKIRDAQVKT